MRRFLYAARAALGIALAPAARAELLTVNVLDDGTSVALACAGGLSSPIVCSGGSTHYANSNVAAKGVPTLPDPDRSTAWLSSGVSKANVGSDMPCLR
jgi:hypothetical protein